MSESQQYDPAIESNMETKGLNKGRITNQELARELAEKQQEGGTGKWLDDEAKEHIASEIVEGEDAATENLARRAVNINSHTEEDINGLQRLGAHERVEKAFDRAHDALGQYDELQASAKVIRDIHQEQAEIDNKS